MSVYGSVDRPVDVGGKKVSQAADVDGAVARRGAISSGRGGDVDAGYLLLGGEVDVHCDGWYGPLQKPW